MLCTVAVRHGALSVPTGQADIVWSVINLVPLLPVLRLTGRDGAPVALPGQHGFGARMAERQLAGEPQDSFDLHAPAGLSARWLHRTNAGPELEADLDVYG